MDKEPILVAFGQRIRQLRKSRALSQENLAFSAGVHRTYVGMIERGEKNITLSNIRKMADAFGISVSELLKDL